MDLLLNIWLCTMIFVGLIGVQRTFGTLYGALWILSLILFRILVIYLN